MGNRLGHGLVALGFGVSLASGAYADVKDEIVQASKARDTALVARDQAALNKLFDEATLVVDLDGRVHDKGSYIAGMLDKQVRWITAKSVPISVRVVGDTVIDTGTFIGTGTNNAQPFTLRLRYTSVWVRKGDGSWAVTAGQETVIGKDIQ
jgi:ketosteroid isomerase-like protein